MCRWCALCNRYIDGTVVSLHIEDILIPLSEEIASMHAGNAPMADALSG